MPQSVFARWTEGAVAAAALALAGVFGATAAEERVASPDGRIVVTVTDEDGKPRYRVDYDGAELISGSALGFRFAAGPDLEDGLTIASAERRGVDVTWEQPWGERRLVRDRHEELAVVFADEAGAPAFSWRVRVFDDGLGFRAEVAPSADGAPLQLVAETTEFRISGDATAWSVPAGEWNRYEYLYAETPLAEVSRAHTPFTVKLDDGPYLAFHEAALVDYPAYWINQRRTGVLTTELVRGFDGVAAHTGPDGFTTPWRTVQIADAPTGLANSDIVLNLNEPNKLGDVSWVEPGKYVGIWWGMHLDAYTWGSGERHGATTERTKRYIDFAAEHGFSGVLVEGWNLGWDGDWFFNGNVFDFTTPYPDFDLEALAAYARAKGVRLIGHHETSAAVSNYERQLDAALDLYARLGVAQVKTGYVSDGGDLTFVDASGEERHEWHDGQFAVNHHIRVLEAAAKRKISINAHEPVKDTGLRRTYPNALSREGARGQEYNAWGRPPNPPEHVAMLAFTRMLSGPMDFTPGMFDLAPKGLDAPIRTQTTLAHQLAQYVVIYSPVQMAADLIENYEPRMDAFQFIKDVPVDWEQSIALDGAIGDYVVFARQERGGADWYLGAVTDEAARTLEVPLDFLPEGRRFEAQIYRDGPGADWRTNPYALTIERRTVSLGDTLVLPLGSGGGAAVRFAAQ